MSFRRLGYVIGSVVVAVSGAMLVPAGVALIYQEWGDALAFVLSAAGTALLGLVVQRRLGVAEELTTREGFATVGLSWLAMTVVGTVPYVATGAVTDITNAFFETAAGFSTTGSSIIAEPEAMPHGVLLWRALTQWMGGMGIIVLSVAILPLLGVGGVQLVRAESPGVQPDRLTPRFSETAKRLWLVYFIITVAEVGFLVAGEMTLFESVAHALTTMSTGGFSTSSQSLAGFSAYSQWVVIVFMVVAGVNFALHFRAARNPNVYSRDPEFRLYVGVLAAASMVIFIGTRAGAEVSDAFRDAAFTAVSMVTTTGYGTADFAQWAVALQILVVGLMFLGGMAGSTAGSVKMYRHGVLASASYADLRRLIHPRGVFVPRLGRQSVSEDIVESVQAFFLFYMFIFMTGTLMFGIIESVTGNGLDIVTSASAVASALGNIGPGLAEVGPTANYLGVAALNKWLLSLLMIVGRLEIFPMLLLFTPELWRR